MTSYYDHVRLREHPAWVLSTALPTYRNEVREMTELPTVTRTVTRLTARKVVDETPDLSWLDQADAEMGDGFEAHAAERRDAFQRGDWDMVGVVVTAWDESGCELDSDSLWGIESDSDDDYFALVASECAAEIAVRLGVDLSAVPFDRFIDE